VNQVFVPLDTEDEQRLSKQRTEVNTLCARVGQGIPQGEGAVLKALQAILDSGVLNAEDTYALQCLGVVLGDVLAGRLGLTWRAVVDAYGRDPCLVLEGTSIILFPLTMISKRVERGEAVDIRETVQKVVLTLDDIRTEATRVN
jgi:hypothetical protein